MPRITHVKKAQQRYETVPVLDENGQPKRTPVMRRDGTQKVTKRGKPVFMAVTAQDKTRPKPPLKCDFGGCDIDGGLILPGTSYKHITPKSGPYGGYQRNRHSTHPDWKVWEYSSSVSAQLAQVQDDMHTTIDEYDLSSPDDFDDLRDSVAEMARSFADERQEAVDNMPEGLQDGSQAQEYAEAAESWADEVENVDAPDFDGECGECSGQGTVDCDTCNGQGQVDPDDEDAAEQVDCDDCDGKGTVDCDECGGSGEVDAADDWVEEAKQALRDAVDECQI